jgi:hypothetical protein
MTSACRVPRAACRVPRAASDQTLSIVAFVAAAASCCFDAATADFFVGILSFVFAPRAFVVVQVDE